MHIETLSVKESKKSIFAALIALTFLLAMLPFAAGHSGDTMNAPRLTVTPTIDGNISAGEWDDANVYNVTGSGGTSYLWIKHNFTHLFILIDSPWDTTPAVYGWYDNSWTAFDTAHNDTANPQADDYIFNSEITNIWNPAYQGTGAGWGNAFNASLVGYWANQSYASGHKVDEIMIPLAYVGTVGGTSGFYIMVIDDSSDPDGFGLQPATDYVEWPPAAGGDPAGWPPGTDPCPAPSAWGNLKLTTPVGGITIPVDKLALLAPYIALAAAMVALMIGAVYARKRWFGKSATPKL